MFSGRHGIIDLYKDQFGGIGQRTICIFSVPSNGGRILPQAADRLANVKGDGSWAIICVTFGDETYGSALAELTDIVSENGFHVIAGCALATKKSGEPESENGVPESENGVHESENGVLESENGVPESENGVLESVKECEKSRLDASDRAEILEFAEKVLQRIREGRKIYPPAFPGKQNYEGQEAESQKDNAFFVG